MLCVIQCTTCNDLNVYPTRSCSLLMGVGCVIIVAEENCDEKVLLKSTSIRDTRNIETSPVKFSHKTDRGILVIDRKRQRLQKTPAISLLK